MKAKTPSNIEEKFEEIKKEYPFPVHLHTINGHYYVYRQMSKAEYLGRIDVKGGFIKKEGAVKGTEPLLPSRSAVFSDLDEKDLMLLKILSMNATLPLKHIGKLLDMPTTTIESRLKTLENRFAIKYFAEIDIEKLGYIKYLISVKFRNSIPKLEAIKQAVEREPRAQLAIAVKGSQDIIIYALGRNNDSSEAIDIITSLRRTEELSDFEAEWASQPFYEHFGTVPLRKEFFDLLEKRVFKRKKEKETGKWPGKTPEQIFDREFIILKEFGLDGAINFSEIERKYCLPKGSAGHVFDRLRKRGLIKRITMTMTNLPVKYIGILYKGVIDEKRFVKNRKEFLQWIIEYTKYPINKFTLAGDTVTPDGSALFMPIFDDFSLDKEVQKIADRSFGIQTKVDVGTTVMAGTFCYRLFDIVHSRQQEKLQEKFGIPKPKTMDYETLKKGLEEL